MRTATYSHPAPADIAPPPPSSSHLFFLLPRSLPRPSDMPPTSYQTTHQSNLCINDMEQQKKALIKKRFNVPLSFSAIARAFAMASSAIVAF